MPERKRTIAILWHERQRQVNLSYMLSSYVSIWREDGHEVFDLYGADTFRPADLAIVHVDLSVVPDRFLELAARFPIALNVRVRDIRKSTYSSLKLTPGDAWTGQVIVKSNLNFAGTPERVFEGASIAASWSAKIRNPDDYLVLETIDLVPRAAWQDPNVIVERFVPEREDGLYVVHTMVFMGDHATCARNSGPKPILHSSNQTQVKFVDPHPEMLALRKALGFDFGKFDYLMSDGKPVLLDANKTVGGSRAVVSPERAAARLYRARGLYAYFEDPR